MSKLTPAFSSGKALITFVTCGDPDIETTCDVIRSAQANGADIIEIGIPFSDPTAEAPVIQEAGIRALAGGVTTDKAFKFIKEMKGEFPAPCIITAYANVVFSYGTERFIAECSECGVGGLEIIDLPFEEKEDFDPVCRKYGVDLVSVIAPASRDRIAEIAKSAVGFIPITMDTAAAYADNKEIVSDLSEIVSIIRENTDIPCALSYDELPDAGDMRIPDGIIACSALPEITGRYGKDSPEYAGEYVKKVKAML